MRSSHPLDARVLARRRLCWRQGPARLSRIETTYSTEQFTECRAAFLATTFLAAGERYILWGYGSTGKALRRALLSHGKRAAHIVELHPGRLGQHIDGARVIHPDELPRVERHPLIVSVAGAGPRGEIRAALAGMGFQETTDFFCAA